MGIIATINPEAVSAADAQTYALRQAARAVVFDAEGRIALLHVTTHNYFKLPGGGVEPGEDIVTSLRRECLEEIGCDILLGESVGEVHEYRSQFAQHQISYCFTAQVLGQKGKSQFTEDEQIAGFQVEWFFPDEACMIFDSLSTHEYVGQFIIVRERAILAAALTLS